MLNPELVARIHAEVVEARNEGLDESDVTLMAQGAGIRFAREQGIIGEEAVSPEMLAAIASVVEQEKDNALIEALGLDFSKDEEQKKKKSPAEIRTLMIEHATTLVAYDIDGQIKGTPHHLAQFPDRYATYCVQILAAFNKQQHTQFAIDAVAIADEQRMTEEELAACVIALQAAYDEEKNEEKNNE